MSKILSLSLKDKHLARLNSSQIGQMGEELAAHHLLKNGYRLVLANFKVPIGRNRLGATITGEIDLIALDNDVLCFVEVKTRSSDEYATPESAVNARKQRQIIRTAKVYRKTFQLTEVKFRYDVISIVLVKMSARKSNFSRVFGMKASFAKKFGRISIKNDYFTNLNMLKVYKHKFKALFCQQKFSRLIIPLI